MKWQDYQAYQTRLCGSFLVATFQAMPSDKIDWLPGVDGSGATRTALDLLAECIHANTGVAAALGASVTPGDPLTRPFSTPEEAVRQVKESSALVVTTLEGLTDEVLDRVFQTPMMPMPGRLLVTVPALNMQYHNGQLNLLQLLYGDAEMHFPPMG
jgi:hypothetical protein